ncbi:MAG TPA: putative zinc-binding protein [Rhodocyclaceae bacterium]|nr:putative zinc-binding protein [Rhodocyclaceae bacterium]HMV53441.1 putative zinc-binding protein [Rhodocyclaceae bacterium]HNA03878.1 putative zinc-binding protein [Rhodocyclaceae bacterium]HNB79477.1 putative zinc-binding protein [Rhodocyclaceae bacterium]HNH13483.1 putative zinc-binding protein [Rhodocyclaceae bacterium]
MKQQVPLIYACSGCSSAAQLANALAIRLDRARIAEMSCVSGVGGDVAPLVEIARSGRAVVSLDGCEFTCARRCLARHDVTPACAIDLSEHGIAKRRYADFLATDFERMHRLLLERIAKLPA